MENVKVIAIAMTEDELKNATIWDLVQKALQEVKKTLGIDSGINDNVNEVKVDNEEEEGGDKCNYDDVYGALTYLLADHDTTTNLDIKNILREKGYWVSQSEVSAFMNQIMDDDEDELFNYYVENGHRVYFYNSNDEINAPRDFSDDLPIGNDDTLNNDTFIIEEGDEADGDWEVYYMGDIIYVDGSVTRSKARVIGSHVFGIDYNSVRACRYHEE